MNSGDDVDLGLNDLSFFFFVMTSFVLILNDLGIQELLTIVDSSQFAQMRDSQWKSKT